MTDVSIPAYSVLVESEGLSKSGAGSFWKALAREFSPHSIIKADLGQVLITVTATAVEKRSRWIERRSQLAEAIPAKEPDWIVPLDRIGTVELQNAGQFTGRSAGDSVRAVPSNKADFLEKTGIEVRDFHLWDANKHWLVFLFLNDGSRERVCTVYEGYDYCLRIQRQILNAIEDARKAGSVSATPTDYL